jgi:hypothetical protein
MTHRNRTIAAFLLGVMLAATLFLFINGLIQRVKHAETTADTAVAKVEPARRAARDAKQAVGVLAQQLREHGVKPRITPSDVPGPTGATGAQGLSGPRGPRGGVGPMGAPGASGPPGQPGNTGPKGTSGQSGPVGDTGPQGPAGPKGDTGDQGPAGPQGDSGPAGYPGQFTFGLGPVTYVCTDPDGDHQYECTVAP